MIRQHIGGGKGVYVPKLESDIWEKLTKNDTKDMDDIIVSICNAKLATPVIVAIEQELGDEVDPNTYHLYLAFPETENGVTATPARPKFYARRVRVPLVVFGELLAKAFEGQMTSTALCFVADASSGMGSEMLTTVVKKCDHGVVSPCSYILLNIYLVYISQMTTCNFGTGNNLQPCMDVKSIPPHFQENTQYYH